jgi:pyruvate formate lyase activating enzyme
MKEIEKDEVFYLESGGGVTFSGGEPLMQADALKELLEICKTRGYHTAIDTSGYADNGAIRKLIDLADLWLFDLKIMDDIKHVEYTGVSNELSFRNLETLAKAGEQIVIRFPLIPGITDDIENLEAISSIMKKLKLNRIDILPYHSIAKNKYFRMDKLYMMESVVEPDTARIEEVREFFKRNGMIV